MKPMKSYEFTSGVASSKHCAAAGLRWSWGVCILCWWNTTPEHLGHPTSVDNQNYKVKKVFIRFTHSFGCGLLSNKYCFPFTLEKIKNQHHWKILMSLQPVHVLTLTLVNLITIPNPWVRTFFSPCRIFFYNIQYLMK